MLAGMLSAGVDVAGVNGMTMDFGSAESPARPMSAQVIEASTALHGPGAGGLRAGRPAPSTTAQGWAKVGITPMIGQNDVQAERFTLADAAAVNEFARAHGVGQLSMWSLNRDSTCAAPLPAVLPVVQNSCSGVDQGGQRFADVLSDRLEHRPPSGSASAEPSTSGTPGAATPSPTGTVDDPAQQPLPDLGPAGAVPGWHQGRLAPPGLPLRATGPAASPPACRADPDSPWKLVGPVLPGDTPAPLPTLPAGHLPPVGPDTGVRRGRARAGRAGAL